MIVDVFLTRGATNSGAVHPASIHIDDRSSQIKLTHPSQDRRVIPGLHD
jgi:hypothetical protein